MKRRELLLIGAVLVPFFVLVVLALVLTQDPPTSTLSPVVPPAPAPSSVTPQATAPAVEPVVVAPAPRDAGLATTPVWPRALAAPLAAVTPEVMRCFDDQRAHLREVQRLEVRFRPLPDGGFSEVRVASTQNPYIAACVEDVFDELGYVPSGAEDFARATHVFEFDPQPRPPTRP